MSSRSRNSTAPYLRPPARPSAMFFHTRADLPIMQELGLNVPDRLLALAKEVIE